MLIQYLYTSNKDIAEDNSSAYNLDNIISAHIAEHAHSINQNTMKLEDECIATKEVQSDIPNFYLIKAIPVKLTKNMMNKLKILEKKKLLWQQCQKYQIMSYNQMHTLYMICHQEANKNVPIMRKFINNITATTTEIIFPTITDNMRYLFFIMYLRGDTENETTDKGRTSYFSDRITLIGNKIKLVLHAIDNQERTEITYANTHTSKISVIPLCDQKTIINWAKTYKSGATFAALKIYSIADVEKIRAKYIAPYLAYTDIIAKLQIKPPTLSECKQHIAYIQKNIYKRIDMYINIYEHIIQKYWVAIIHRENSKQALPAGFSIPPNNVERKACIIENITLSELKSTITNIKNSMRYMMTYKMLYVFGEFIRPYLLMQFPDVKINEKYEAYLWLLRLILIHIRDQIQFTSHNYESDIYYLYSSMMWKKGIANDVAIPDHKRMELASWHTYKKLVFFSNSDNPLPPVEQLLSLIVHKNIAQTSIYKHTDKLFKHYFQKTKLHIDLTQSVIDIGGVMHDTLTGKKYYVGPGRLMMCGDNGPVMYIIR